MKHDTADELHTIVNHVPLHLIATGKPMIFPDGIVSVNAHKITALCRKLTVKLCSFYHYSLIGCKTGCGFTNDSKHFGKMLIKFILDSVKHGLLIAVDLVPDRLTLVERKLFDFNAKAFVFFFFSGNCLTDVRTHIVDALAELIYSELLDLWLKSLDFLHDRFDFL